MTKINASPERVINIGYEGEDKVTQIIFPYSADWLTHGAGTFNVRVLRHGESEPYNAQHVSNDSESKKLTMTVTDVELSVEGTGEMQVVYMGTDFVKKSPVYAYHVSRAIDGDPVDPPSGSIINQLVTGLASLTETVGGLQTAIQSKADSSTVSALAETIAGIPRITVDSELSASSENPVQNKVISTALSDKAGTATATTTTAGLMSAQDKTRLDAVYADYSAALTALGGGS